MRVLMTHELFMPVCHGGGEEVVYHVTKTLQKKGVYVEVLTTGDPKIKKYEDIVTHRIPINRYALNFAIPQILKKAKDFDLIQTNNYNACFPSYVAGKLLKKPVVCIVHGMYGKGWIKMRGKMLGSISDYMERMQILHNYDKVVFLSSYARKQALEHGLSEKITKIIPPGLVIDRDKFKKTEKEPFVFFAGRLAKQKGLKYLMLAARELPDIKFKLTGKGRESKALKEMAPKNVEFLGWIDREEMFDYYSKALVFCLPSIGEGFGLVLAEAMASGCAIVSTIPLDYEGFKVEKENTKQLVDSIRYLIENPKEAQRMGEENRKKSKIYTWDNFTDELIKVYEEVL